MTSTYVRLQNRDARTRLKRLLNALVQAGVLIWFLVMLGRQGSAPVVGPIGLAIVGAAYFALVFFGEGTDCYDLELDDGGIRLLKNGEVQSSVRKDKIHFVAEWGGSRPRLVVAEKGLLFTGWPGHRIAVPATAPGYEQIRSRALGWLDNSMR
jgi:hypothetical protein